jgi:hypothetical protein
MNQSKTSLKCEDNLFDDIEYEIHDDHSADAISIQSYALHANSSKLVDDKGHIRNVHLFVQELNHNYDEPRKDHKELCKRSSTQRILKR